MSRKLIPYAGKESETSFRDDPEFERNYVRASKRNQIIADRHLRGDSHPDIAADYGISRERVGQILAKLGVKSRRSRKMK